MKSEEIYSKKQNFHEQIRRGQMDKLFTKLRKQKSEHNLFMETKHDTLNSMLDQLMPHCMDLVNVIDGQKQI